MKKFFIFINDIKMLKKIIHKGLKDNISSQEKKHLLLSNQIAVSFIAIGIAIFLADILSDNTGFSLGDFGYLSITFFGGLAIVLNIIKRRLVAKLILSLAIVHGLLFYPIVEGMRDEYFFWFPYAVIASSVISHLIFSFSSNKGIYFFLIIYHFALLVTCDWFLQKLIRKNLAIEAVFENANKVYIIMSYIIIFIFLHKVILYLKYVNNRYEKELENAIKEIEDKSIIINDKNTQLEEQNEELILHKDEIAAQNEELEATLEELKETQMHLIQSEKMVSLGVLTSGIAHEINNPINFISSGIDALEVNMEDMMEIITLYRSITPENVQDKLMEIRKLEGQLELDFLIKNNVDLINSITNGVKRVSEIINGLRIFSRIDKEQTKETDIHKIIEAALTILKNKYKERIEIVKEYGKLPSLKCYPGRLNQVFTNLLSNAIDSIREKGTITICTNANSERVELIFRDTGSGMNADTIGKIFEPFYTTKDVGKGTGLGLSISYGIIKDHNGVLRVKSEVGKGSEFIITLPLMQPN